MHILLVHIHVKPECVESFKAASAENARNSVREAGLARFDFIQQADDPNRFVLVEAYRSPEAHAAHRETRHYQLWKETVEPMMAEPRKALKYSNVFPPDADW